MSKVHVSSEASLGKVPLAPSLDVSEDFHKHSVSS